MRHTLMKEQRGHTF